MALNPTTGADTGSINITVAGVVDPADETRVKSIAISPDGTRLVATGNFATVNGQGRRRAFMVNLGSPATLSTWHAPRFDLDCSSQSRQVSAQGVDFSPDGTYFVIVSTGGPSGTNGLCDAAARFETANVSATAAPTWINWTGGDTLYSVAVTGPAVYVGGHQRWLDNPLGNDSAGPGAVERPGIGAIDPVTGRALAWNPTKSREHGTTVLFATSRGLWVGSDGTRFGREDHLGIGFAPLNLGPTPDTTRPDTFINAGPSGSVSSTSATFSFSATEPSTFQCRLDGGAFAPCTSPTSYANLAAGSHTFQVAATDGSFNVDASPAARAWTVVAPSSNLVGNPGFEVDTSGWKGDASTNTLSRVAGGHTGGWAAAISNSVAGGACGIDDKPSWVSATEAGAYTVSIWARSDTPGLTLKLRVREYVGGVLQGSVSPSLALTSSWQQVTAVYTPVAPGTSSLDVEAFVSSSPVGVCFLADDASITH
jgi:WD40-like Beta Propeller Repeat